MEPHHIQKGFLMKESQKVPIIRDLSQERMLFRINNIRNANSRSPSPSFDVRRNYNEQNGPSSPFVTMKTVENLENDWNRLKDLQRSRSKSPANANFAPTIPIIPWENR
jgi:hypothetical protein